MDSRALRGQDFSNQLDSVTATEVKLKSKNKHNAATPKPEQPSTQQVRKTLIDDYYGVVKPYLDPKKTFERKKDDELNNRGAPARPCQTSFSAARPLARSSSIAPRLDLLPLPSCTKH